MEKKLTLKDILVLTLLTAGILIYLLISPKLTTDPTLERQRMAQLEEAKEIYKISEFESDGCSGNISNTWNKTVEGLSKISPEFQKKYSKTKVPFENACVKHDRIYHSGIGGYVGRLIADNQLREDIISCGIENSELIVNNSNIENEEDVIFIYELVADAVYDGVRAGGMPCTGNSYAWGFGYNNGVCE